MTLTNEQLALLCKVLGIHRQKLYQQLEHNLTAERKKFISDEIDDINPVVDYFEDERDRRRKAEIA